MQYQAFMRIGLQAKLQPSLRLADHAYPILQNVSLLSGLENPGYFHQ